MKVGILSDTHDIATNILEAVIGDLINRGVAMFIHCGDINEQHVKGDLCQGMPVVCVLTKAQKFDSRFEFSPDRWRFTRPGSIENRIVNLGPFKIYAGHERSMDVLRDPDKLAKFIQEIEDVCDGVRYIFTGHTHQQFLIQRGLITWINPGAVCDGSDGYEFALIDTDKKEVIFTRIPQTKIFANPSTVGIISDTGNISQLDQYFWLQAAQEFHERDAKIIIHCGNIWLGDIGHPQWRDFEVYYYLLADQKNISDVPANWHLIPLEKPIVDVCGHRFCVEYDLGLDFFKRSEYQSIQFARELSQKYHHVDFVLCGFINDPLYEEGADVTIINPGNTRNNRNFATICLPRREITFSTVRLNHGGY
ncbi:metallophosphoesterase family protein [Candidatus Falkowbacteria bacterium]|nr:metallophosphoesterase family protein [Candidatus Falkowbacteria bacterium]